MKSVKIAILFLICAIMLFSLTACGSNSLTTSGCRVIRDDGKHITYQTVCDNCGYEFGSPTTITGTVFYSVPCTQCSELIYVEIARK